MLESAYHRRWVPVVLPEAFDKRLSEALLENMLAALSVAHVPMKIKSHDGPEWAHCYRAELMLGSHVKGTYCTAPGITSVSLQCKTSAPFLLLRGLHVLLYSSANVSDSVLFDQFLLHRFSGMSANAQRCYKGIADANIPYERLCKLSAQVNDFLFNLELSARSAHRNTTHATAEFVLRH